METLPTVASDISVRIKTLEDFKETLPSVPTEDLVDGYIRIKDLGKRIDSVTQITRTELLFSRFADTNDDVVQDEKGNRYLSGNDYKLKAERRTMAPKIKADKALEFFEKIGLLNKVVDISVSLSTDDVAKLLTLSSMFDSTQNKVSKVLGLKPKKFDMETAKKLFQELKDTLAEKSQVTINEDKISALVALEEIKLSDIEHLFDYSVVYALKEEKEK